MNIENPEPRLVKVTVAAGMLGVGRSTVYELIRRGELETVHIGRACRVPTAAIQRFVDRLRDTDSRPASKVS